MAIFKSLAKKVTNLLYGGDPVGNSGAAPAVTIVDQNGNAAATAGVVSTPPQIVPPLTNSLVIPTGSARWVLIRFDSFTYNPPNNGYVRFFLQDAQSSPVLAIKPAFIYEFVDDAGNEGGSFFRRDYSNSMQATTNRVYLIETFGLPFLRIADEASGTFSAKIWTTSSPLVEFDDATFSLSARVASIGTTGIIGGFKYLKLTHLPGSSGTVTYSIGGAPALTLPVEASYEVPFHVGGYGVGADVTITGGSTVQIDEVRQ